MNSSPRHLQVGKVWDSLVGAYRAKDGGWIRIHTNWPHHKLVSSSEPFAELLKSRLAAEADNTFVASQGLLKMLNLPDTTTKDELARTFAELDANDVAERAMKQGLVATALRSFKEW